MTTTPTRWKAQSQVNTTDGGFAQFEGEVAASADGGYFVVWTDSSAGNLDIVGRPYDAAGNPLGGEFGISALGFPTGDQHSPDIAVMTGGGLAVAFVDFRNADNDIWVAIRSPTLFRNDAIDLADLDQMFGPTITMLANTAMQLPTSCKLAPATRMSSRASSATRASSVRSSKF
jgi:hypothetical protein